MDHRLIFWGDDPLISSILQSVRLKSFYNMKAAMECMLPPLATLLPLRNQRTSAIYTTGSVLWLGPIGQFLELHVQDRRQCNTISVRSLRIYQIFYLILANTDFIDDKTIFLLKMMDIIKKIKLIDSHRIIFLILNIIII